MKSFLYRGIAIIFVITAIIFTVACTIDLPYFMELGMNGPDPYPPKTFARGVSANGEVVVGYELYPPYVYETAFRWTMAKGKYKIEPNSPANVANAVSGDGTVVVGHEGEIRRFLAFWHTETSGSHFISDCNGCQVFYESRAWGASYDGSVIVGDAVTLEGPRYAFRWTAATGVSLIGVLPGDIESGASSVSADGNTVVGSSENSTGDRAFIWKPASGMVDIGHLPNCNNSRATDVSADGTTVVGASGTGTYGGGDYQEAFRWTIEGSMQGLGHIGTTQEDSKSFAIGVSGDGAVVVGKCNTDSGLRAFIWRDGKMFDLKEVLETIYGLNLSGWTLSSASDISADGRTIVGNGTNPNGNQSAWVAHLGDEKLFKP